MSADQDLSKLKYQQMMQQPLSVRLDQLREIANELPLQSGVYLMKNHLDKIIYVGKAKALKNRVRSYFQQAQDHSPKTRLLVQNITHFDYILTKTEVEAFLLEASLIKKHRPKYNIRLKDDKSYPYIKLSLSDDYPRLYVARKVKKDGSLYFGPYTSGLAVQGTIRFLNRTFKIRDCTDAVMKTRKRPCMTHQIGRCTAPCVNLVTQDEYGTDVKNAKAFLQGKNKKLIQDLKSQMLEASDHEKFEVAARLRDSITAILAILEKQTVINASSDKDQDAVGFFGNENGTLIETIHIRSGRVIGTRAHFFPALNVNAEGEDPREWLVSFLNQYYEENVIPEDLLLPVDLGKDLNQLLEAVLMERSGSKVTVRFATDEKGQQLVSMANQNAQSHFQKQMSAAAAKDQGLREIQEKLHLPRLPKRIECYDISHFQGDMTVASQVVFEDGVPSKDHYRRYKIKTIDGPNDFASMKEVISRRLKHQEWDLPDLILVDGGKGQLSSAEKALEELGFANIPLASIAKARTNSNFQDQEVTASEERFFLPGRSNPVTFRTNSEAFQILTGLRDEAHRFAITFHRQLRENKSLESELDLVVGLGEKRKKSLLLRYKDLDAIRSSSAEEIAAIKGFNLVLAERILLHLNEQADES